MLPPRSLEQAAKQDQIPPPVKSVHEILKILLGRAYAWLVSQRLNPNEKRSCTPAVDPNQKLLNRTADLNHIAISQLGGHQSNDLLLEWL